ncbi:MAG: hypothetical protein ACO1NW_11660 [Chitinophagaceae bacterium]
MKPLEQLINAEKARLLHQLFPQEIPALLDYTRSLCTTLQEETQLTANPWDNSLFTSQQRRDIIRQAAHRIGKYGHLLHTRSRLFADQLFDGHTAVFMVHVLTLYTTTRQHDNHKFAQAISLLFKP